MIKEMIKKAAEGIDLTYDEAAEVTREIMTGSTTPAQTAAYLTALHIKGETTDEISASAYVMRDCADRVNYPGDVLEIVGTGGDGSNSINVSTISALVCAAADPAGSVKLLDEVGMCFLFAQKYHSAMKYVGPVRKEIGIPTVFNILGPLTNPAHANVQLLGVYKPELLMPMAKALTKLGVKRGMAVYGTDKLDEISVSAPTKVVEFSDGNFEEYEITPEQFGMKRHDKSELAGGTPAENAEAARCILYGEKGAGRDAVLLNAGAALHILKGITIEDGIQLAADTIDSGAAMKTLEKYIKVSNEVKA